MNSLYDAIVVGAGPAGLLVADRLERAGHSVLLLEAGPRRYVDPAESDRWISRPMPKSLFGDSAWRFRVTGAEGWWPRAYAVGGRGNLWGGWLSRFSPETFDEGGWPYRSRTLAPAYREAERWLGALREPLHARHVNAARALGVRIRPGLFATGFGRRLTGGVAAQAQTETVALRLDPERQQVGVLVARRRGQETLRARTVVLAASPLETTRLLLESGLQHPWIGRRLTDHLVLGYFLFEPNRPPVRMKGARLPPTAFIPRFVNLRGDKQRRYRGGYSVELNGPIPSQFMRPELQELLGRAVGPGGSFTLIHAVGEQTPHRDRYVDLTRRSRDSLGRRLPHVHFAWSGGERRMVDDMRRFCVTLAEQIASPGAELVRSHDPFVHPGLFHPAGTCAMGATEEAPCTAHGRLRQMARVWVADASALPSNGDGHPTLTVLAHALRVAADVERALIGSSGEAPGAARDLPKGERARRGS